MQSFARCYPTTPRSLAKGLLSCAKQSIASGNLRLILYNPELRPTGAAGSFALSDTIQPDRLTSVARFLADRHNSGMLALEAYFAIVDGASRRNVCLPRSLVRLAGVTELDRAVIALPHGCILIGHILDCVECFVAAKKYSVAMRLVLCSQEEAD